MPVQIYGLEPEITEKVCSACREELSVSEYHVDAGSKDGYRHACKSCSKKQNRQRYATARKVCVCCGLSKPRREYYSHKTASDGLRGQCKACTQAKDSARRGLTKPAKPEPPYGVCVAPFTATPGRLEHYRGLSFGMHVMRESAPQEIRVPVDGEPEVSAVASAG